MTSLIIKEKYLITGMSCAACSSQVQKNIDKLPGVKEATVNLLTNSLAIVYDQEQLSSKEIIQTVEKAGYGASLAGEKPPAATEPLTDDALMAAPEAQNLKRVIWSVIFLAPLMYVSMGHMLGAPLPGFLMGTKNAASFALTQFLLCLPIIVLNRHYYSRGLKNLFRGVPNMDSLIAVGSGAALVYGVFALYRICYGLGAGDLELVSSYHMDLYFESAATILTLISLGRYFEARSKGRTGDAIRRLIDLQPQTALLLKDDQEVTIAVEQITVGDLLVVKPGQSVPCDGIIVTGSSAIDESMLSGESIPIAKNVGDAVVGASLNRTGAFTMRATKVGEDTALAQIVRLVEEAGASKAPIARMADRVAGVFVPLVIVIALVATIVWLVTGATFEFSLSIGITVLVISCPCALGLATPLAIMVGTGKGAENGILLRSGEALETAHNLTTVVVDKTGTLTEGKPQVVTAKLFDIAEDDFWRIAKSLEKNSEHPLAEAVLAYEKGEGAEVSDFRSLTGRGISARVDGRLYFGGNRRLLEEQGLDISPYEDLLTYHSQKGRGLLLFADEKRLLAVVVVADVLKPTSAQAVQELKDMQVEVVMLSGDNRQTAESVGRQVGIDRVISEVLPEDKVAEINRLKQGGRRVAMVGDGINDAPALVAADVGMAIGAGTDVAIESADVILMRSDLLDVPSAIKLSKAVIKNIKQNLFWAFFYNAVGIPVAAGVLYGVLGVKLTPMIAALAMSLSSLFVVTNALRLRFFNVEKAHEQEPAKIVEGGHKMVKIVEVSGMTCPNCVKHVTKALEGLGATNIVVSLKDQEVRLEGEIADELIKKTLDEAGYQVVGFK